MWTLDVICELPLREIVRALRHEINLQAFCAALMHDRSKEQMLNNFEFKVRNRPWCYKLTHLAM